MTIRRLRVALWVLAGFALIMGLVIAFRPPPSVAQIASDQAVADIGGPFTLTGTDGKSFASRSLAGKPFVIFFGFTHCPDVCPTTLARLARLRKAIGKGDDAFAILFVSVDPARDTPPEMNRYASLFDTPIVALTGSEAQIDQVKRAYGIYSAKVPQPGGDYSVDHTATIFLMDGHGKFAATITPDEGDRAALSKLRNLTH